MLPSVRPRVALTCFVLQLWLLVTKFTFPSRCGWPIQYGWRYLPQIYNFMYLLKELRNALCCAFSKKHLCCITLPPSGRLQNTITQNNPVIAVSKISNRTLASGHDGKAGNQFFLPRPPPQKNPQWHARQWTIGNKGQWFCETGNKQGQHYNWIISVNPWCCQ